MHSIKLAGVLQFISLVIISLIVFLYFVLNTLVDTIVSKNFESFPNKEYEYRVDPTGMSIPEFTYSLESLFPSQIIPEISETIIIFKPALPFDIPLLQFIGMIETDEKIIYSLRNIETKKLLLFEQGVVLEGITLVSIEEDKYTFKKNEIKFQVDK